MKQSLTWFSCLLSLFCALALHAQDTTLTETVPAQVWTVESSDFKNLSAEVDGPRSAELRWNFNHRKINDDTRLKIRYKLKLKKQDPWKETADFSADQVSMLLEDLEGKEEYKWQVGAFQGEREVVWSSSGKFKTKDSYGWFEFLTMVGSLGLFIFGMKIMSEGLQKAAGDRLRSILRNMTSTRVSGIVTGFLTTTLIQSSSATTVMVVSFVNAGLLTLGESMGVIMGANIGTTVTGWLIAYFGFKVKIEAIAIILIGIFFPFLFAKKANLKHIAEFIVGFGVLFIGLAYLKDAVPDIKSNPGILEVLAPLTNGGMLSVLFFVFVGTVLTVVIQSSSATMAVTLVMLANGWITFPIACAMVLGENIGTTITANIAALVGNVHAKRAARFHLVFNLTGVVWMLVAFQFYIPALDSLMFKINPDHLSLLDNSEAARTNATLGLSMFHTTFNILNVLLLAAFVPYMERLVIRMQASKGGEDDEYHLKFISSGMVNTPALSLENAREGMQLFAKLVDKMSNNVEVVLFKTPKNVDKLIAKVGEREDITDRLELELADYLAKVSESELTTESSERVQAMLSMGDDLERIGDIFFQMTKNFERMRKEQIVYPDAAMDDMKGMYRLMMEAIRVMRENIGKAPAEIDIDAANALEKEINDMRKAISKRHHKRLEKGDYSPRAGIIYQDFINRIEKVGDHAINVTEALVGLK